AWLLASSGPRCRARARATGIRARRDSAAASWRLGRRALPCLASFPGLATTRDAGESARLRAPSAFRSLRSPLHLGLRTCRRETYSIQSACVTPRLRLVLERSPRAAALPPKDGHYRERHLRRHSFPECVQR